MKNRSERSKLCWQNENYRTKISEISRKNALKRWKTAEIQPKKKSFYEKFCQSLISENYNILTSLEEYCKIGTTMRVRCPKGHLLNFSWKEWKSGRRCRICPFESTLKNLDLMITRKNYDLIDIEISNIKWLRALRAHIVCPTSHTSTVEIGNFLNGHECKYCVSKVSEIEYEIKNFLNLHSIEHEQSNRTLIAPYELDFIIPKHKIAIEFDGYPYHTEKLGKINKNYHLKKTEMCESIGYQLIHIFYDEWEEPLRCITQRRLLHLFDKSNEQQIQSRKCQVKEISTEQYKWFTYKHHLQGYIPANVKLGLFHEDELISIMSFNELNKENNWELLRYCSSCIVTEGVNKLFSYFKNNYQWEKIVSYSDRRWNIENLYKSLNFSFDDYTECEPWYMRNATERLHRSEFEKLNKNKSIQELKYDRIWDCGYSKFKITRK